MAVQKSKKSKSKKLQKRAHQSLSNPTLSTDPGNWREALKTSNDSRWVLQG